MLKQFRKNSMNSNFVLLCFPCLYRCGGFFHLFLMLLLSSLLQLFLACVIKSGAGQQCKKRYVDICGNT